MSLNQYVDENWLRREVAEGRQRQVIGGLWDAFGQQQLDFLKSRGLRPEHSLLDIGCGSGRLAVKAVPYLQPQRYFGIDISPSLVGAAGQELEAIGCANKLTEHSFHLTMDFAPRAETGPFDFGMAQSVFTHLPLDHLPKCLNAIRPSFQHGRLFATFFVAPPGVTELCHEPGGVVSFADRNPFHFTVADILAAARSAGWQANWIGAWNHPRDQQMCQFVPAR